MAPILPTLSDAVLFRRLLETAKRLRDQSMFILTTMEIDGEPVSIAIGVGENSGSLKRFCAHYGVVDPRSTGPCDV